MILQPGILAFFMLFVIASAMNVNDDNIDNNIDNVDNVEDNDEVFANVLLEAEEEVDRIALEKTINGYQSRLVPGHSRRGVNKQ